MTPKEKAQELYYKYFSMIKIESPIDRVSSIPYVKQCALIAVDEMINTCNKFYDKLSYPADVLNDMGYVHFKREREYLLEVKQEINNL